MYLKQDKDIRFVKSFVQSTLFNKNVDMNRDDIMTCEQLTHSPILKFYFRNVLQSVTIYLTPGMQYHSAECSHESALKD